MIGIRRRVCVTPSRGGPATLHYISGLPGNMPDTSNARCMRLAQDASIVAVDDRDGARRNSGYDGALRFET